MSEQQQHWTKTTLGDIAQWSSGGTPKTNIKEYYHKGTIPFIKSGDLKDNINININDIKYYITEEGLRSINGVLIPKGTVLLAEAGNITTTIGEVAINNIKLFGASSVRYAIVNNDKIINYFLYFYLLSQRENIRKRATGTAIKHFTQSHINTFPISLPPLEEQEKISSILKQAHILNKGLNEELNKVTSLFKSLLNRLLSPKQYWTKTTLGDIAEWISGIVPEASIKEYYDNGSIPLIKSGDLKDNINININDIKHYITEEGLKVINNKLIPVGTVLIATVGNGKTRGRCAITAIESVVNSAMKCAIVDNKKIINYYLYYYLLSQYHNIRKLSVGGARKNLFQSHINTFPISLPPLKEQQKIVNILSSVQGNKDSLIGILKEEIKATDKLFRSLLSSMMDEGSDILRKLLLNK